jgi:hypothetical protein
MAAKGRTYTAIEIIRKVHACDTLDECCVRSVQAHKQLLRQRRGAALWYSAPLLQEGRLSSLNGIAVVTTVVHTYPVLRGSILD